MSYLKKVQFEASLIASEVGKLFGGASEQANKMRQGQGGTTASDPLGPGRTSGEAMMGSLGFRPDLGINKATG